jgi:hypothetical protein
MDLTSLLGGISIGRDTSGNFKPSIKGLAVRTPDGKYLVPDGDHTLDVTDLTLDNADSYVYRLPVQHATRGDLIITSENPLAVFLIQEETGGGHLKGLNLITNTLEEYVPPTNLLNMRFYIKVVSLLDGLGDGMNVQNLLPLLLLTGSNGAKGNDGLLLLLASSAGKLDSNNLLPLLLLQDSSTDGLVALMLAQTLTGGTNHYTDLIGSRTGLLPDGNTSPAPAPAGAKPDLATSNTSSWTAPSGAPSSSVASTAGPLPNPTVPRQSERKAK